MWNLLIMLTTKTQFGQNAIASVFMVIASLYSLPINAQTTIANADLLQDIEAGEDVNWSFSSEEESISIKDDLEELREYNLSEEEDSTDVELTEEKSWGNRGDVEDRSVEVEVYDY